MRKKVLAIYYSQSGQLEEIIDQLCAPLTAAGAEVEKIRVRLKNDYPFPWTSEQFFQVMPDCVMGVSAELMPVKPQAETYDLVILGYQAWFLSPSIPFNSIMQDPCLREVIKNSPVITVTGARNMWVTAFGRVKEQLREAGARHVGTIALMDRHLNLVSIFTIFHWMLGGRKDRYLGFFPKPGVSEADIAYGGTLGAVIRPHLADGQWEGLKEELVAAGGVNLKYHLLFMEGKAAVMFRIWARWISGRKKRKWWLAAFKYYLLFALFIFAPLVYVIDRLIFKPFLPRHIKARKESCLRLN